MKEFWNTIQLIFTAIGGWLGYFLGGCDGLLIALVAFVAIDYITGVMCAVADKKLSSEVGFKGICRKVLIFLLVGIANIVLTPAISLIDSEVERMNEAEFHAEKMYLLCLGTAKTMLKKGVISEEEFTKIDTMLLEKYKPTLSTLLSGKPLI